MTEHHITKESEIDELILKASSGLLLPPGEGPDKNKEFYLFRGMHDETHKLLSSLTRHAMDCYPHGQDWKQRIQGMERKSLENLKEGLLKKKPEFDRQYSWASNTLDDFLSDTYRILSIMQHYGEKTRLLDFTSSPLVALFFATYKYDPNSSKHFMVYRLRCKNDNDNDEGGDKTPKDSKGNPFKQENASQYNANTFLGRIICYSPYKSHRWINLDYDPDWSTPRIPFGWDQPRFRNPNLKAQDGFLVYNVDVRKTHEETLGPSQRLDKFLIDGALIENVRSILKQQKVGISYIFPDLDKTLEELAISVCN